MKDVIHHYDESKMRLLQAQALLTGITSEESIDTLPRDTLISALLGIQHLVEEGERDLDKMLDAARVGEVLT